MAIFFTFLMWTEHALIAIADDTDIPSGHQISMGRLIAITAIHR